MNDSLNSDSSNVLKHNQDIYVSDNMVARFEDISSPLNSSIIQNAFKSPEFLANSFKSKFNTCGIISLFIVIIVLIFTVWKFASKSAGYFIDETALWIIAILGISSFILALVSHFFSFQDEWLFNRFVTERLRQFKFQQLLDGEFMELATKDSINFEKELSNRFAKFEPKYINKLGSLGDFVGAENFNLFINPNNTSNINLSKQIFEAYFDLRLDYQARYFKLKQESLTSLDEWTKSIAKISLLTAFVLALAELYILLRHNTELEKNIGWIIGASAVSSGLISAGVRVFRNAKAISEEAERYTSKWVLLKILSERFCNKKATSEEKLQVMIETERVSIEELREFIRTFKKSDYLL